MRVGKNDVALTLRIYGGGKAESLFNIFSESLRKAKWDSQLLLLESKALSLPNWARDRNVGLSLVGNK